MGYHITTEEMVINGTIVLSVSFKKELVDRQPTF